MRKALTKTAAQFKEEGEQRQREILREKRVMNFFNWI